MVDDYDLTIFFSWCLDHCFKLSKK